MNLLFLVEGSETEPKLYRAWIGHIFPALRLVETPADMDGDTFCIISGGGYPAMRDTGRIRAALCDVRDNPRIDHLFLCVDAEDAPHEKRRGELAVEVATCESEERVRRGNPAFQVHLIVQQCCPETWFLGHTKMMARNPTSPDLLRYQQYFDVREHDPQEMGKLDDLTRAQFHERYLKAMLREKNDPRLRYSKQRPGPVLERHYLDALRERIVATDHLSSLAFLLDIWDGLRGA